MQGSNPGLLCCQQILYHLSHQEALKKQSFVFCTHDMTGQRYQESKFLYHGEYLTPREGIFVYGCVCVCVCVCTQSCPTLCNPMDCSLPYFSGHWIFQAIILAWVPMAYVSGSSQHKDWACFSGISCTSRQILHHCTTWGALNWTTSRQIRKPYRIYYAADIFLRILH